MRASVVTFFSTLLSLLLAPSPWVLASRVTPRWPASWSSCLCFLVVHRGVPHVGHQPIGSAWSLRANRWLRVPGLFFCSRTRWLSRSSERGIPSERAACCQGLTSCKGSDVLSVGDRRQEDNYSAVIFDNTGQYATESKFLVLKEMIFPCLSLLCIYSSVR